MPHTSIIANVIQSKEEDDELVKDELVKDEEATKHEIVQDNIKRKFQINGSTSFEGIVKCNKCITNRHHEIIYKITLLEHY